MGDVRWHGRSRAGSALVALVAVAALVVAACGSSGSSSSPATTRGPVNTVEPSTAQDFSGRGPHPVGLTTLTMGDRQVFVFYPADPAKLGSATHLTSYSSAQAFPEQLRAAIPRQLVQDIPIDVYQDAAPAPGGPFPVVVHSHGFGGYPLFESDTMSHEASWGFVVAAPDHIERDLAATTLGKVKSGDQDVTDLRTTYALLQQQNASGPLAGSMQLQRVAAEGHSAGGGAALAFAQDPEVSTVIGLAPASPVQSADSASAIGTALASVTPPAKPVMLITGAKDGVVSLASVQAIYDWLHPPKRMVVLADAGHNAFTDLCGPIRAQGGLLQYSGSIPAPDSLLRLGQDGCVDGYLDPATGHRIVDHLTVAELRWTMGIDPTDASLAPAYVESLFPGVVGSYSVDG